MWCDQRTALPCAYLARMRVHISFLHSHSCLLSHGRCSAVCIPPIALLARPRTLLTSIRASDNGVSHAYQIQRRTSFKPASDRSATIVLCTSDLRDLSRRFTRTRCAGLLSRTHLFPICSANSANNLGCMQCAEA